MAGFLKHDAKESGFMNLWKYLGQHYTDV